MADLKEVYGLGRDLLDMHGLRSTDFHFFGGTASSIGWCEFADDEVTPLAIRLSGEISLINDLYASEQIILHEIAHGVVGYQADHNQTWMDVATEIGVVDPGPCFNGKLLLPEGLWNGYCPECSDEYPIDTCQRRPLRFMPDLCWDHNVPITWLPRGKKPGHGLLTSWRERRILSS